MMTFHYDEVGETGLRFFGKMTASIAHEVKNVLAIINENAGLLNDFALLAQKGRPVDPARLENTAQNILRQISRADGIVKNMSAFAHSVDGMEKQVDFNELTRRIILLAGRLVSIRGISITLIPSEKAVMLNTNPFLLENLIWLTLAYAMDLAGSAKEIFAEIRKEGDEISLNLSKLGHLEQMSQQCPPEQSLKKLLAVIEAELVPDIVREELILRFSEKI